MQRILCFLRGRQIALSLIVQGRKLRSKCFLHNGTRFGEIPYRVSKLGLCGNADKKEKISRNDEGGGCFLRVCRETGLALCCSKARNVSETGNETMTDRSLLKNDAFERFTFEE
ncbi:hypothetical protein K0M31_019024, partial [Melipona bicolor]